MSAIRLVAPCGCEYVVVSGIYWVLLTPPQCEWSHEHAYWKATRTLRPEHIPIIATGYAMAARDGRGPWARYWPGRNRRRT